MNIIIVGAGIAGLASAYRLSELSEEKNIDINISVLESSNHIGGNISTLFTDNLLIEEGPDSFITSKPYALNLCDRLGIKDELIQTSEANRKTLIYLNGRLTPIPDGFILLAPTQIKPFISSPILSTYGKIRAILEIIIPKSKDGKDESLYSFIKRRFGRELFENIAQPLVGGIYTSDPYKLSVKSAIPEIYKLENKYGSVIIGLIKSHKNKKQISGARYSQFVTLKNGMNTLVSSIISAIPSNTVITGQKVKSLFKENGSWKLLNDNGRKYTADGVILACPSFISAELLDSIDSDLSKELLKIEFASSAIIILAYKKNQIKRGIGGFGFVVPHKEKLSILACSFSSEKFTGRAPDDLLLIRCFVGGALNEEFLDNDDNTIINTVKNELRMILDTVEEPVYIHLRRYPKSMPQYNVGHENTVSEINQMLSRQKYLQIAGNSYEGVGIPDCIRSGESAAEKIVDDLIKNI